MGYVGNPMIACYRFYALVKSRNKNISLNRKWYDNTDIGQNYEVHFLGKAMF